MYYQQPYYRQPPHPTTAIADLRWPPRCAGDRQGQLNHMKFLDFELMTTIPCSPYPLYECLTISALTSPHDPTRQPDWANQSPPLRRGLPMGRSWRRSWGGGAVGSDIPATGLLESRSTRRGGVTAAGGGGGGRRRGWGRGSGHQWPWRRRRRQRCRAVVVDTCQWKDVGRTVADLQASRSIR